MFHFSLVFLINFKICLTQAEEEMKQKMILIQEIRAMESKPIIRHKLVDFTSTGGFGLLSEMSIAEVEFF